VNNDATRSAAEIRRMMERLRAIYDLGGPPVQLSDGTWGNLESSEAHGLILAELDAADPTDEGAFLAACREVGIDTLPGLRALLRLVASAAALAALSWGASEPTHPDVGGGVPTESQLLDEAAAIAWWDEAGW
jgi:hypothetical protein